MQQQGMEYMDCIGCFPSKLLDLCLWKEKISFFFPNQEVRVLFKVSCMIIFAWKRRSLHVLTQLRTAIGDQIVHICHTNLIIGFLPSKIFQKCIHSLSFVKKKCIHSFSFQKYLEEQCTNLDKVNGLNIHIFTQVLISTFPPSGAIQMKVEQLIQNSLANYMVYKSNT